MKKILSGILLALAVTASVAYAGKPWWKKAGKSIAREANRACSSASSAACEYRSDVVESVNAYIPEIQVFSWVQDEKHAALQEIGQSVAQDEHTVAAAKSGGWTMNSCKNVGRGLAVAGITLKGGAYCVGLTGGETLSMTACMGALIAAGSWAVDAMCTQLQHDGHLREND